MIFLHHQLPLFVGQCCQCYEWVCVCCHQMLATMSRSPCTVIMCEKNMPNSYVTTSTSKTCSSPDIYAQCARNLSYTRTSHTVAHSRTHRMPGHAFNVAFTIHAAYTSIWQTACNYHYRSGGAKCIGASITHHTHHVHSAGQNQRCAVAAPPPLPKKITEMKEGAK